MHEQLQTQTAGRAAPGCDEAPGAGGARGFKEYQLPVEEKEHLDHTQAVVSLRKPELTMSSREIAELTGKQHKDVMRDVRVMLDALGHTSAQFCADLPDAYGRAQPVFLLPKDLSITLVSGYSVQMRHRIVVRWLELEARQVPALPRSFAEALRLAADQAEQLEAQRAQIEQQRPAVEFVGRYVEGKGLMGVRQVAKLLKANEREFCAWLEDRGVMYRLAGRLTPVAHHQHVGRFEVKTGSANNGHAFTSAHFTPKGVEWVASEWSKHKAGAASRGKGGRA